jgi:hypothetical protein
MTDQLSTSESTYWQGVEDTRRSKMVFFDSKSTDAHVPEREEFDRIVLPKNIAEVIDIFDYHSDRIFVKLLLNQGSDFGYSLVEVTARPGTVVPRHKHPVDQVVICLEGSMTQGNKVIDAGCGYYTPADHVYAYVAGPNGVRYLEFRNCPLDMAKTIFVEDDLARWPEQV